MTKATTASPTCDDCYFRRQGLCALLLAAPCPTFRPVTRQGLQPPKHPPLIARPSRAAPQYVAA